MTASHSGRYLLLVGCSQRKTDQSTKCSAIERYDGVNYRVLRKLRRKGLFPSTLDVLIISAKFGLLEACSPIEKYDLRMTSARALELQADVGAALDTILAREQYAAVFVNVGKTYRIALDRSAELHRLGDKVIYASGGIGMKMAAMREWILHLPGQR